MQPLQEGEDADTKIWGGGGHPIGWLEGKLPAPRDGPKEKETPFTENSHLASYCFLSRKWCLASQTEQKFLPQLTQGGGKGTGEGACCWQAQRRASCFAKSLYTVGPLGHMGCAPLE